jgi:hypothetical protein
MKEYEMKGACSTHGRDEKWIHDFLWGNLKGWEHAEDLGVYGKIILERIGWEGVDWIHSGKGRDQWRALVNIVMNLRVP